jgi:hypothetical protein
MLKLGEIRKMAKRLGVNSAVGVTKTELIRRIQTAEGNFACFRTAEKTCDQQKCLWLDDCVGKAPDPTKSARKVASSAR